VAFTYDELRKRGFDRVAHALHSFWEEQKDDQPRAARVHSRLFETLIYNNHIELNEKTPDRMYPEHVVPCAYIRDHAFEMYWNDKTPEEVSAMIGRLLRIAYIRKEDANKLNKKHKSTMPEDWDPASDSILRRLEDARIAIVCEKNI